MKTCAAGIVAVYPNAIVVVLGAQLVVVDKYSRS
jgi:hypothetical protein